jgi:hypothetical protein
VDFPISVPSIGLVDGKFVDEDPLVGTPGSLIPSAWGNAVTEEMLAVITAAGLTPDEEDNTQLNAALGLIIDTRNQATSASQAEAVAGTDNTKRMTPLRVFQAIAAVVAQATEAAFGWAKIATQAQTNAGTDDSTIVTPKKNRAGFRILLGANGYIGLPTWLSGFLVQWGVANSNVNGIDGITLPTSHANLNYVVFCQSRDFTQNVTFGAQPTNLGSFNVTARTSSGLTGTTFHFISAGF